MCGQHRILVFLAAVIFKNIYSIFFALIIQNPIKILHNNSKLKISENIKFGRGIHTALCFLGHNL